MTPGDLRAGHLHRAFSSAKHIAGIKKPGSALHTLRHNFAAHLPEAGTDVHMIVPGGGLSPDATRWIACRPGFLLPVRVLARLFRRLFLEGPSALHKAGQLQFFGDLEGLADPVAFSACRAPLRIFRIDAPQ